MSLLMEALKRAERSKQGRPTSHAEQPGRPGSAARTPNSVATPGAGFSLLPHEMDVAHVGTTGNSDFPPITTNQDTPPPIQDLAHQADENQNAAPAHIEPAPAPVPERPLAEPQPSRWASAGPAPITTPSIEPEARPQPAASVAPSIGISPAPHVEAHTEAPPQNADKIATAQQKARTVFSAKQPTRNRTLLLAGAAAAIALGLAGFGIYYWQITSTSTMPSPAGTPQPTSVAAAPASPVETVAPVQNPVDKPAPSQIEESIPVAAAPASPPATPAAESPARAETRSAPEPFKEKPAIRIRQSAATSQLNPMLGTAYQSFLSGDTATAQQLYQKMLQQEPNNRDALLGMAAIALRQQQTNQAAAYYGKLLELDPADPEALAGLIGLQGQSDPTQSESRLKKVLAQNPQADAAHFALGNLYAQQSRWAEAQQSYFRAYSNAPRNADYAFNLAISLDHLNQGKLALDYYQRALAQPGPANFDKSAVQTRINELQQPAGN